jgi:hypothetical protein
MRLGTCSCSGREERDEAEMVAECKLSRPPLLAVVG